MRIKIERARTTATNVYKVDFTPGYSDEVFDTTYYMAASGRELKAAIMADIEREIDETMDEIFDLGVPAE